MLLCIEVLKWLITGKFGGDRCFFLILTQHRSRLRRKKSHLFGCRINSLWNALSKIFGVKAAVWIQERNGEKQARDEVENPKNATFMSVWEQLHSNSDVRSGNITQTHNNTEKRGSLWLNLNWRWQLTDSSLNSLNWCLFSCFLSSKWWREAQTTSSASSLPTSQKRADSLPQLFFFFSIPAQKLLLSFVSAAVYKLSFAVKWDERMDINQTGGSRGQRRQTAGVLGKK